MNANEFKGRLHAAIKDFRKLPKPPLSRCMWWKSECDRTVSSHSVSRAWLGRLAPDGHVIHFRANVDVGSARADVIAESIGANAASVFPGFCAQHDSEVFRLIDAPLAKCGQRECDLLVFRSVCREAYTKYKVASFNLSQGMVEDHPTPHGVFTLDMMLCSVDLLAEMVGLENALDEGTSHYCHYAIEFRTTPIVAACATFNPQVSFDGLPLTGRLEWITISVLPATFGGIAVFSWKQTHSQKATSLLDSFLRIKPEFMSDVLLRYVIDNAENAFYSPTWWEGLLPYQQTQIVQRYKMTLLNSHTSSKDLYGTQRVPLVDWNLSKHYPVK